MSLVSLLQELRCKCADTEQKFLQSMRKFILGLRQMIREVAPHSFWTLCVMMIIGRTFIHGSAS